jgi:hypothetical protein
MTFLMAIAFVGFTANVATAASANLSATNVSSDESIYEAEFREVLEDLIARLRAEYIEELDATSRLIEERRIIEQMKVTFFNNKDLFVTIEGVKKQVDALNYPELKLIEVDSRRWIPLDKKQRERLVLHEVYGLLGWERNVYGSSERDLGFLYGYENPQSRADECPLRLLGTHQGDRCLWVLADVQEQQIEGLQEALLTFTVPRAKDDKHMADYRARIKRLIEKQKAEVESDGPDLCDLQVTSDGNNGAYDRSLCVLEAWDHVLKLLRKLYKEIKAIDPNLPELAPVMSRIG